MLLFLFDFLLGLAYSPGRSHPMKKINSRTPRNYEGVANPGKKIADLLPGILNEIGKRADDPREEIFGTWFALIGEKMAPLTEPLSFADGVLTVKVKSSTLYSLLCLHEKPRLLKQMQEKFSVRNIVFRIG
jgi:Dna[CI] antecedent DciA-like protein